MARILYDGRTYEPYEYESESEFEAAIIEHSKKIFGPKSVYFDIKKRLENQKILTIPDGYLLDFSFRHSPRLYIIENELVEHDPFRHIGHQLLRFATAYESSRHKLKQALSTALHSNPEKRAFVKQHTEEADIRNMDVLLDEVVYNYTASAIVVIDTITDDLENVLGQLTMGTDVVEFRSYIHDGDLIHHVRPFQQDVRDVARDDKTDLDPEELDTVVVPERRDGFEETFLEENCWYKIGMASAMVDRVEYIAAYQTAPVSAITHFAEVASIDKYQDTGKYILHFKTSAKELDPIPLPDDHGGGLAPQARRYTTFDRLMKADTMEDVFP